MCGICGVWSKREIDRESVHAMCDTIRHRGPDDDGFYFAPHVALGHRRLSIIDLEHGKQPISNESATVHVVFNGEIYNFRALRRELQEQGHQFSTNTDTEVIVHLYEELGPACADKLQGMFAFALWDESRQLLLLARDPLGQKPLYYAFRAGEFVFASEIKAVLRYGRISPRLNTSALHHTLSLRCDPGSATLFEGVQKLPAGHTLVLEHGKPAVHRYWDLTYLPKLSGSEDEIAERLQELLEETVESHLISDVPLGAFLSGGMDSSLVVALMTRLCKQPVKTFSIGCPEAAFDELPYARILARHCGTDHYEATIRPDLITALPEMLHFMEEPVDPYAFGIYSAAQLAARHVKVVLGGDGGDEIFGGYDRYLGNRIVDLYCLVPPLVRRTVVEPLIRRLPDNYRYNNRVQKLRWLVAMSHSSGGRRYAQSACFLRFSHEQKRHLYSDGLWQELEGDDSESQLLRIFDAADAHDALDRMLYTDVKTRMADNTLMIADRMTMAHSLEARSPLLDQRVAEFGALIPADLKIRGRCLRYIQRKVAQRFLPQALTDRPKKGFGFPLAYWFRNELRELTRMLLTRGSLVAAGYFRPAAIESLLDEHVSGKMDHNYRLWLLLNAELWHRLFIDGNSRASLTQLLGEAMPRIASRPRMTTLGLATGSEAGLTAGFASRCMTS